MSGLHRLSTLAVLLIGRAALIIFISLINALVQNLAPDWVRARVPAIFILVYQGSYALGTAAWGAVAQRSEIRVALVYAGIGTTAAVAFFAPLPVSTPDLSPWNHWRMPVVIEEVGADIEKGPVLVTIEYAVIPEWTTEFVDAMALIGGRSSVILKSWIAIWRYFMVNSWAEHPRQTHAGRELEGRIHSYLSGEPTVRHLIYTYSTDRS